MRCIWCGQTALRLAPVAARRSAAHAIGTVAPGVNARQAKPDRPTDQAAAFRFISSLASTHATVASSSAFRMPCCAVMLCTSRSTRSMFGAPANSARGG